MLRILFVCMGNICRSPSAEGVFLKVVAEKGLSSKVEVHSAGTHAYHVGEPPDERSAEAALRRGVDISRQRARHVHVNDFETYDYILAMDKANIAKLMAICPEEHQHKVKLFLEYAVDSPVEEVPDPYYGGPDGFERVLDLIEAASEGLMQDILLNIVQRN